MSNEIMNPLIGEIKEILNNARYKVAQEVNHELLISYWKIREIVVVAMNRMIASEQPMGKRY